MTEATISLESQEQVRALFGPRDRYLRLVQDSLGIDVVLRGDEIRLLGTEEHVNQGLRILDELCEIIHQKQHLPEKEVYDVLHRHGIGEAPRSKGPLGIELNERKKNVTPKSQGQADYIRAIRNHDVVLCAGPAGSGKTYLAVAMAINALRTERVRRIVLVRPAVEAGERLGFLPGDMLAKVNPFLRPLLDALNDMLSFDQVERYMENDVIEIVPLAFMRGRTLNDTFMILDEAQNTTVTQMKMFLTRMGEGSQIVVTGDATQVDLEKNVKSGLSDAIRRLQKVDGVAVTELSGQDIVRHKLVRDIVDAYDEEKSSVSGE
ncbi:MAG: PhoH family protein [Planctomycetaceae bacterium]